MRLWHYELIPYLPNKQIVSQWRELSWIFSTHGHFIIIDYVYDYPKDDLYNYSLLIINEMKRRGFNIKSFKYFNNYFEGISYPKKDDIFINNQNDRYLLQCFYNLQEKHDRGQKDFTKEIYNKLKDFVTQYFKKKGKELDLD